MKKARWRVSNIGPWESAMGADRVAKETAYFELGTFYVDQPGSLLAALLRRGRWRSPDFAASYGDVRHWYFEVVFPERQ